MAPQPDPGNPRRRYHSPARADRAAATRRAVLAAAHELFVARGYAGTGIRTVAEAAGVSVATVEQAFGTKRNLLNQVVDVTRAGDDLPVPLLARAPARAAEEAESTEAFLAAVAAEIAVVAARSAGIQRVLAEAAAGDLEIAALAAEVDTQRRVVAAWVVDGLARRARLRDDRDRAVDVTWTLLDPAVHRRLTGDRSWSATRFAGWLADALRLLLTD